jgi:phosphoketolase
MEKMCHFPGVTKASEARRGHGGSQEETMKRIKRNFEAQEKIVSALWEFAADTKGRPAQERGCRNLDLNVSLNLDDVGKALEKIMSAFGYQVVSVQ